MKKVFNFFQTFRIVILHLLFYLISGSFFALNHYGFCYKTGKFFSELDMQPKIDEIIREKAFSKAINSSGRGKNYTVTYIPYPDIETFKKINPNCCEIRRGGDLYATFYIRYWRFVRYPNNIPINMMFYHLSVEKTDDAYYISRCGDIHHFSDFW